MLSFGGGAASARADTAASVEADARTGALSPERSGDRKGQMAWQAYACRRGGGDPQRENVPAQTGRRRTCPIRIFSRSIPDPAYRTARHSDQPLLHDRFDANLARSDRDHGQARGPRPGLAMAARRSKTWR